MVKPNNRNTEWLAPPADQQGLKRYVDTIRERIWLVIGVVMITTLVALVYVATADEVYEAEADILVSPVADEAGLPNLGLLSESNDPLRVVETAATLIHSNATATRAAENLGLEKSPRELLGDVTVQPVAESDIVTVTAQGSSPEEAADLANGFARAAVESSTEILHDRIDELLPTLTQRIEGLPPGLTRDTLTNQVAQLETLRAGDDPTLQVAETATPPTSPASPRRMASIAAGVLAGLVLGIGGAFALQVLDPRLRREEQLRARYRLPVLARIPDERTRGPEPLRWERLSGGAIEAFRTLRAILARPLSRSGGVGSILVTSAGPSEGKTTTAINLATSLALAGKQVILIEADLRRPSIGKALGIRSEHGVVSVLIEGSTLEESLVTAETGPENLRYLLAEEAGITGAELLSLPAAQALVEEAKLLADYVVVDSPPLATVIDALPLGRTVDDLLVVVRLGVSRLHSIQELAELLGDTGLRPAGFAVVGVPRSEKAYYDQRQRRLWARNEPRLVARSP